MANQRAHASINLTCIEPRWKTPLPGRPPKPDHGPYYLLKDYFVNHKRVNHFISIDLNGRDESRELDLSKNLAKHTEDLQGPFNIITNFGTSEHVEGQYWCFRNIHKFCELGGIIYHKVPRVGNWEDHCPYYFDTEFFEKLALLNGYEIIVNKVWNHDSQEPQRPREECVCIYRKVNDAPFVEEEEFNSLPITKI